MSKHLAILGAGPGGYVAAIRAAQLGARVTVIENQALGGVCLNWGCIPSKALLSVVELGDKAKKAKDFGILLNGPVAYDPAVMVARKNKVVSTLVKGIATLFKTWNIEHVEGTGELVDARTIRVTTPDGTVTQAAADGIIIATGSSWPNLPLFPIDGTQIMTSKQALDLARIPASLLIVGGGVEGCEFASLYSGLGTEVTLVELVPRLLPLEDEEISQMMERELKKRGVDIRTGVTVDQIVRQPDVVTAHFRDGLSLNVEQVLVSVGRGFNSRGIGLEQAGVQVGARGEILVNERMETNVSGVYAIGDVVGKAMLAHVASQQGKVAVENFMGHSRSIDYDVIPTGIFTLPEIGRVGLTEQQARERSMANGQDPQQAVKVGRFRYGGLGKAQATGDIQGLIKVVADGASDRILGVHILGAHATDLIHEAALAMQAGTTVSRVAEMIHAHPTLAEGLMEAMEDVHGHAIHLARKPSTS
ncbi:MAG: dihydrolipoyl dehydrogenase [Nitrospira sp.]|nr:dihydrolipoyl dehydrogenase [Nitrospira sp.]MCC7472862.1 dihydrolipoyl dehydrogenase [Candidatus Nomurabacteria bacterium]